MSAPRSARGRASAANLKVVRAYLRNYPSTLSQLLAKTIHCASLLNECTEFDASALPLSLPGTVSAHPLGSLIKLRFSHYILQK